MESNKRDTVLIIKGENFMKKKKILGLMLTGIILANVMPQVSLAANDYNVKRIQGKNRYETSLEVMKHMNKTEKAVLADGRNYPDALSAAPLAVKKSTGILLSDDNAIDNIKSFIDKNGIKQVTIIGGEKSVSKTQFEKLTGEYKHQSEKEDTNSKKDPEKVAPNDVEKTKSEIGRDLDLSKFDINTPLSQREKELANLVNEYRKSKGLKPLKISKSLTFVTRTHNNDQNLYYNENWKDKRGLPANLHSWSNKGKWTPVMYTSDHKYAEGMWNKPSELTDFKVDGFEISAEGYFEADESAEFALKMWKESEGHNAVLTGQGNWNSLSVMGVSINGDHADIWFADETNDPAGFFKLK